jgi:hypothetical protein
MPEVKCINKTPRNDPHDRIRRFGGPGGKDGGWWYLDHSQMVAAVENNTYGRFWVTRGGATVYCIVATHNGNKYVKTENDGLQPDNLLSLPECQ